MKIIEQTQTRLQLEAKPFTAWFFASAQLIAGLCFVYISSVPTSSKQMAIPLSIVFLGASAWTLLTSSINSITFDKIINQLLLERQGIILGRERKEFQISEILTVSLIGFGGLNRDTFWEIIVRLRGGETVPLAAPSTDRENLKRVTEIIQSFLTV